MLFHYQISNEAAFGNSWVTGFDPACIPQEDVVNPCLEVSDGSVIDLGRQMCDVIQDPQGQSDAVGNIGIKH